MHNMIYPIYINSFFQHSTNLDSTSEGLPVLKPIFWSILSSKKAKQFLHVYTVPYYSPTIQNSLWVIKIRYNHCTKHIALKCKRKLQPQNHWKLGCLWLLVKVLFTEVCSERCKLPHFTTMIANNEEKNCLWRIANHLKWHFMCLMGQEGNRKLNVVL